MEKNILYYLRLNKNLKQREIANYLNISQQAYQRYETSKIDKISYDTINKLAQYYEISVADIYQESKDIVKKVETFGGIKCFEYIPAGVSLDALPYSKIQFEENILDDNGNYICLKMLGDSMHPHLNHGDDIVIDLDKKPKNNDICAVMINGNAATFRKIQYTENGIKLIALNIKYESRTYTQTDIESLPIEILGVAVCIRSYL